MKNDMQQPLLPVASSSYQSTTQDDTKQTYSYTTCDALKQAISSFKPSGLRLCCSAVPEEIVALEDKVAICQRQNGSNLLDISNTAVTDLYQSAISYLSQNHYKSFADEKQGGVLQYKGAPGSTNGVDQLHINLANQFLKINYPKTLAYRTKALAAKLQTLLPDAKFGEDKFIAAPRSITEMSIDETVWIERELIEIGLAVASGVPMDGYDASAKAAIDQISLIGDKLIEQIDRECKQVLEPEKAKQFDPQNAYLTHLGLGNARILYKALMKFNQELPADLRNTTKKSAQEALNKTLHEMGKAVVKAAAKAKTIEKVLDQDLLKLMNRSHLAIEKFNADAEGGHEAKKYAGNMKKKAKKIFDSLEQQQQKMVEKFTPSDAALQEARAKLEKPTSTQSYISSYASR